MLNKRFHNFAVRALAACFGLVWTERPSTALIAAAYNPVINQEDFVPEIDYKSFTLKPGTHQDTRKINPEDFITEINNKYFTLKTGMNSHTRMGEAPSALRSPSLARQRN